MTIEIPHYQQEKRNTCALACLRMVLAAFGSHVEERALEAEATMEEDGTHIEELNRLAAVHKLAAEIIEKRLRMISSKFSQRAKFLSPTSTAPSST